MPNPALLNTAPAVRPRNIRAVVVTSPEEVALGTRIAPDCGTNDVLIRPVVVGICGTDLDIIDGSIDPEFVRYPVTLGHEWSGVVVEAPAPGAGTSHLSAGDRVVVEGIVPCGHCAPCKAGDTNRCENYDEFGFTRHGAMAELLAAPRHLVHRLDRGVSMESGALVEPAAVVIRGLLRASPQPGERILIIGDGTVALLAATIIQLWSPGHVTMLGRRSEQAALAATAGVDSFETDPERISQDFDVVVEAAGAADAVTTAVASANRGGRIVLLGFPGHGVTVPLPIDDIVNGDLTMAGSFGYTSSAWAHVVALLNAGRLDFTFLVTHRYPLAKFAEAISALRHSTGQRGKVILDISSEDGATLLG
ncbi:zinc-dependent alcohol dehydrogenase [Alpinimonas psychrophila]|uniref:2-desacetyl-2-hydroxyethyl bacteriochlorophyllide A dehydrogenase n=1 Tax=Alpinimonas psychrophila TaxID=748908 RepID=A0A7W3JUS5_9MICO|nr:alcohol dehydrogenase catalytic domain-containing protein [Alpinimonas psychrophila]MBA8829634.1 2-desacetyl-2-hydroxyethyl bacteriochlorophyllide A dehydrogenase [Alpinimonas psychrophila]